MALPLILILIIIYFYSLLIVLFYLEIEENTSISDEVPEHLGPLSIIIPFRNEADQLPGLLEDLANQSYPDELYEVILVDDHSMDASWSVVESFVKENKAFNSLQLPMKLSGKKAALSHGISQAKHDWIIQVDADCRVGPRYIASHMLFLEAHPSDLVAGLVSASTGGGGFLNTFERLDLLSLMGSSAGSFALGRPMMCSGANLAYSRELYLETRSFDPGNIIASGDDMFLMIGARKLGKKLSFNTCRESLVETCPAKGLRTLIVQRIRWGSKSVQYRMPDIQLLAVLVSLCNISILLLPLWLILYTELWPWMAGAWLVKTLADFMLLFRMTGITDSRADLKMFAPVSLLYHPFFVVSMLGSLVGKPVWQR